MIIYRFIFDFLENGFFEINYFFYLWFLDIY